MHLETSDLIENVLCVICYRVHHVRCAIFALITAHISSRCPVVVLDTRLKGACVVPNTERLYQFGIG